MDRKWIFVLILVGIVLFSIYNTYVEELQKSKVIKENFTEKLYTPKIEEMIEHGHHYKVSLSSLEYNVSKVIEQAKLESYAIQILKSSAGCRNPLPDGGCKGGDYISPEYEYFNSNSSTWAWIRLNRLKVDGNNIGLWIKEVNYTLEGVCSVLIIDDIQENICSLTFISSNDITNTLAIEYVNGELLSIGIVSDSLDINISFDKTERYTPILREEWKYCQVDSDCIETDSTCCVGCTTVINKEFVNLWEEELRKESLCICIAVVIQCPSEITKCINNVCKFVPT